MVVSNCQLALQLQILSIKPGEKKESVFGHYWNKDQINVTNQRVVLPDLYSENGELNAQDLKGLPEEEKVRLLSTLKKKVLFIGANDSMNNSICWQLNIIIDREYNADQTHNPKYYARLVAPEGRRLVDVTTWEQGFH